ncbi:ion channel [Pseudomonadota bacterium]
MSWDPSRSFQRLLLTQVALTLVYPLLGESTGIHFLLGAFLVLALYGGVSVMVHRPVVMWVTIVLGAMFVGSYWLAEMMDLHRLRVWSSLWGAAFYWFVAIVLMRYVFSMRSRVDTDLIYGAVSIYLLIGSGFGELYGAFAIADPGAFNGLEVSNDRDGVARSMSYFSFVTLTTLGYGDISPAVQQVKVLAYVEAIIGQFYLAVLVARLVGTHIAQSLDT